MKCAWQCFLNLLPIKYRTDVDRLGKDLLEECRLRVGLPPELVTKSGSKWLSEKSQREDICFVINAASRYSPWAATTLRSGYITAQGGHRIGLCGEATLQAAEMTGIKNPTSVCIRVARDFLGIAQTLADIKGSMLIIGPPGAGKTTLMRDLIRQKSNSCGGSVCVVDERGELFPQINGAFQFETGKRTDVITGCGKKQAIEALLRTMCPVYIAVDEITAQKDCAAMIHAGWSGVSLLATAHAESVSDLQTRPLYRPIFKSGLFQTVIVMARNKSWKVEVI